MGLFDVTDAALVVALQGTEQQQAVLSNNIANANTPGFEPSNVSFQDALAAALQSANGNENMVSAVQPSTSVDTSQMTPDGNGVDIDRASTTLAETQILFDSAMAMETSRLHTMSSIITGAQG